MVNSSAGTVCLCGWGRDVSVQRGAGSGGGGHRSLLLGWAAVACGRGGVVGRAPGWLVYASSTSALVKNTEAGLVRLVGPC